jgi:hypothetical protein
LPREPKRRNLVELAHLLVPDGCLVSLRHLVPQPFQHPHLLVSHPQTLPDARHLRRSLMANRAKAISLVAEVCDPISMPLEFGNRSAGPQRVGAVSASPLESTVSVLHGS